MEEREINKGNENMGDMSAPGQNVMGYMPCNRLLITLSLPMMMSMMVQALYNIVDSIFVARLSENALTAVSLAFPVQSLLIAVISGTGVGINARLSRRLGEKKFKEVNIVAGNAVFLTLVYAAVFFLAGQLICGPFYRAMTPDAEIQAYGTDYLYVILTCSIGACFQISGERLLQSTGKTIYSMVTQGTGAIVNIILDPIMIFGLLGLPAMGTRGAAVATVIGQAVAGILAIIFNLKVNKEIGFGLKYIKPRMATIKAIYAVGFPSIIMQSISSVMNFGMNKILLQFSSTAAAAFGIYFKLQSFVFMPVFGMNNGIVPILSYNLGAKKPDRVMSTFKLGILYASIILAAGFLVFEFLPGPLLSLFDASDSLNEIGMTALRRVAVHFLMAGYSIVCMSMLQATGHGFKSLIVSLVRQLVVLLPAAFFLARFAGLDATWYSFPMAEFVAVVLISFFVRDIMKKEILPLYGEQ